MYIYIKLASRPFFVFRRKAISKEQQQQKAAAALNFPKQLTILQYFETADILTHHIIFSFLQLTETKSQ